MTIQIELSPEAEARLTAGAMAHGIAPDDYAGSLLTSLLSASAGGSGRLTADEVQTMLAQLAEGSDTLPALPTSAFTRDSFYEEAL
jgi:hypothetical protein